MGRGWETHLLVGGRERKFDITHFSDLVTAGESRLLAASPPLTAVTRSQNVAGTWLGDASPGGGESRENVGRNVHNDYEERM